jgi:hypothetical protein
MTDVINLGGYIPAMQHFYAECTANTQCFLSKKFLERKFSHVGGCVKILLHSHNFHYIVHGHELCIKQGVWWKNSEAGSSVLYICLQMAQLWLVTVGTTLSPSLHLIVSRWCY